MFLFFWGEENLVSIPMAKDKIKTDDGMGVTTSISEFDNRDTMVDQGDKDSEEGKTAADGDSGGPMLGDEPSKPEDLHIDPPKVKEPYVKPQDNKDTAKEAPKRDIHIESNVPKGSQDICPTMTNFFKPAKLENECIPLFVILKTVCKNPGSECQFCSKRSRCFQQYTQQWLPEFCVGGVHWRFHRVPSSCACYKLSSSAVLPPMATVPRPDSIIMRDHE
ncbi:unnamed protein product [Owenia fusiformis]|uniref:Uncharacterized protein n=1 Tax=Owenia fusiformis TaxID=6347 RepID=A0A8S4PP21_OWEFU|nr:unnamed protein product [Owenia fusiformis]